MRILCLLLGALACAAPEPPLALSHDSYIWQRRWTPPLHSAFTQSSSLIATWRVLAWEAGQTMPVPLAALRESGRAMIPVMRLNGALPATQDLTALLDRWRAEGVAVNAVEIDHDCPVSQLARYRDFLQRLRPRLGTTALIITALPAWLGHGDLEPLLREVDEAVLQVHAVMNPRRGLFHASQALAWIERWSAVTPVPFRVALPNYGSRVSWNGAGQVTAIESESARYGFDAESRELFASPREVERLLVWLRAHRPARFRGVVWFRLPAPEDRRAWSLSTWHAVLAGRSLQAELVLELAPVGQTGTHDVVAVNRGQIDVELPEVVRLAGPACDGAEALPAYALEQRSGQYQFRRLDSRLLRGGERQTIGWVRCVGAPEIAAAKDSYARP
jgi:hypothetical protein